MYLARRLAFSLSCCSNLFLQLLLLSLFLPRAVCVWFLSFSAGFEFWFVVISVTICISLFVCSH